MGHLVCCVCWHLEKEIDPNAARSAAAMYSSRFPIYIERKMAMDEIPLKECQDKSKGRSVRGFLFDGSAPFGLR
jgi:hypothetical protein